MKHGVTGRLCHRFTLVCVQLCGTWKYIFSVVVRLTRLPKGFLGGGMINVYLDERLGFGKVSLVA